MTYGVTDKGTKEMSEKRDPRTEEIQKALYLKHNTYNVRVTRPSPSMNKDKYTFTADSYPEAVEVAHDLWRKYRRHTALYTGKFGVTCYHSINYKGEATDTNSGSGVPEFQQLS